MEVSGSTSDVRVKTVKGVEGKEKRGGYGRLCTPSFKGPRKKGPYGLAKL